MQVADYLQHGFALTPIQLGKKGPNHPGWNQYENCWLMPWQVVPNTNIGLVHTHSKTCAIDIDNLEVSIHWFKDRGVDLLALMDADDAVQIISGRINSAKLIYRLDAPLPTKQIRTRHQGIDYTTLEFRSGTADGESVQDVLPPSIHPSGTIYTWGGKGDWRQLPELPACLRVLWVQALENAKSPPKSAVITPTSDDEVRSALTAINPSCDHTTWLSVGMALHAYTIGNGFDLWNSWSAGSPEKYPGEEKLRKRWDSFKPLSHGITVATLYHYAFRAGWHRPSDLSMFKPIKEIKTYDETVKEIDIDNAPLPECDLTQWPDVIARYATELGVEVGCDSVVPLVAGICAVAGALDARTVLKVNDRWSVPPTFWVMTLGNPADKKTPGSKPMFSPLREIEREDKERMAASMLVWLGTEARYAAEMKVYRDWAASPESQLPGATAPCIPTLALQPQPLRLLISDASSQKVVHLASHNPGGFLVYNDEMATFLSKLSDARTTDDRGLWIQGYETGPYRMDRVGSGTTDCENVALAFYGNCQPDIFKKHITNASADGILQRFMPVILNSSKNAMWEQAVPSFMSASKEYEQLIRRTHALPKTEYTMSDLATHRFREFCKTALAFRSMEQKAKLPAVYQTALGKAEGNCARLILLFHVCHSPYEEEVSYGTVDRAVNVFMDFFIPSLKYAYLRVAQSGNGLASQVFRVVLQIAGVHEAISTTEIRRMIATSGVNLSEGRDGDAKIAVIMDELMDMGFTALKSKTDGRSVWYINPVMAEIYNVERKQIMETKHANMRTLERNLRKYGHDITLGNPIGYDTCSDVEAPTVD